MIIRWNQSKKFYCWYHAFISGKLPLGYAFEAKDKADLTHQIPPPPFEPAEDDFLDLSSRVLNFLTVSNISLDFSKVPCRFLTFLWAEQDFLFCNRNILFLTHTSLNFFQKNGSTSIPPVYTMDDNMNHNHSKSTVVDFMEIMRDFSGTSHLLDTNINIMEQESILCQSALSWKPVRNVQTCILLKLKKFLKLNPSPHSDI